MVCMVAPVREPVGDRLRHYSLVDDCSVTDNSDLVEDVDLRPVRGEFHMTCAQ